MKREILTKEKCLQDLLPEKKVTRGAWWTLLLILVPVGMVFGLLALLASDAFASAFLIGSYVCTLLLIGIGIAVPALCIRRKYRKIRERRFHIVQDVLLKAVPDADYCLPAQNDNGRRDMLDFECYGKFFLDRGTKMLSCRYTYYKWSENYYMTSKGIISTATPGDTYYLVIYDDDREKKPVMAYTPSSLNIRKKCRSTSDPG